MFYIRLLIILFWCCTIIASEIPSGEIVSDEMQTSQGIIQLVEQDRNVLSGPGTSGDRAFHLMVNRVEIGTIFSSPYNVSVEDVNNKLIFFSASWGGSQSGVITSQVLEGGELKERRSINVNMHGDDAEDELSTNLLNALMEKGMKFIWKSKDESN